MILEKRLNERTVISIEEYAPKADGVSVVVA